MLTQLTSNSYVPKLKHREANLRHRAHQQIGLFTVMTRMRSQHDVPLLTVLLSLQAYATKVHGRFHTEWSRGRSRRLTASIGDT